MTCHNDRLLSENATPVNCEAPDTTRSGRKIAERSYRMVANDLTGWSGAILPGGLVRFYLEVWCGLTGESGAVVRGRLVRSYRIVWCGLTDVRARRERQRRRSKGLQSGGREQASVAVRSPD